ncbi:MAG TPA: hypothetical protein VI759_03235 [Dehalococcoidia bacterium]|nr:hypothetical protein [Dehalococcoidia bacterium]
MQDRYAGDVGDFGKLGLLKALAGAPGDRLLRVGLIWYLFPNESHNKDGKRTSYAYVQHCDQELHDGLLEISRSPMRSVRLIEEKRFLPDNTRYFSETLGFSGIHFDARSSRRRAWLKAAHDAVSDCDVVCVDPDNGLGTKSVGMLGARGPKYTFFDDLRPLFARGQSLVIYQHRTRTQLRDQWAIRKAQIESVLGADHVITLKHDSRLYFVVPQPNHEAILSQRIAALLAGPWRGCFQEVA